MSIAPFTASPAFLKVTPPTVYEPGSSTISPGVMRPSSSAAVAVISL